MYFLQTGEVFIQLINFEASKEYWFTSIVSYTLPSLWTRSIREQTWYPAFPLHVYKSMNMWRLSLWEKKKAKNNSNKK